MTKIERKKQTVQKMKELYFRHYPKQETVPEEHQQFPIMPSIGPTVADMAT